MKRTIELGLVIILTIISVYAMVTVKGSKIPEEPAFMEDKPEESVKPDGTGYLFDDFDKGINIQIEEKEETTKSLKNNESSQFDSEYYRKLIERKMALLEEKDATSPKKISTRSVINKPTDIRDESKVIIGKVRNNISLEDKLSLVKIVSKLSLKDINDIKNAILNGTTNAESIKLWTMLRNKLPNDEYKRLENIITKYE